MCRCFMQRLLSSDFVEAKYRDDDINTWFRWMLAELDIELIQLTKIMEIG